MSAEAAPGGVTRVAGDAGADEDVLVLSLMSGTNGSLGASRRIARVCFADTEPTASVRLAPAAVAGVASVVTDVAAVLGDELEPFSSLGSSKASTATSTTARTTRMIFLRRSAASRAAARRSPVRVSMAVIRGSLLRQPPRSRSKSRVSSWTWRSMSPADPLYVKAFR